MTTSSIAGAASDARELVDRAHRFEAMGGWVTLRVAAPADDLEGADRDLRLAADRILAWVDRITRFDARSELSRLNRRAADAVSLVGPSLGDLLAKANDLAVVSAGLVDVTLLSERLAAEHGGITERSSHAWRMEPSGRRWLVHRDGPVSFDLDGVGKGWIADRALALLDGYAAAMVDADGDVALRRGERSDWAVGIADPLRAGDLAVITVPADVDGPVGIATSGTSVHRWERGSGWAHHLIDPRTGKPADTDVVQATVVTEGALGAEALAKAVVVAGSEAGLRLLERSRARAAFVLLRDGGLIAPPGVEAWLL